MFSYLGIGLNVYGILQFKMSVK